MQLMLCHINWYYKGKTITAVIQNHGDAYMLGSPCGHRVPCQLHGLSSYSTYSFHPSRLVTSYHHFNGFSHVIKSSSHIVSLQKKMAPSVAQMVRRSLRNVNQPRTNTVVRP